ncbi:MAG: hypothetical protein ACHQ50_10180 [Fimbriimonadales bacterium]
MRIAWTVQELMPFWVAFLVSGLIARPVFRALLALKSKQVVSQYAPEGHQKKQGTPTMGGVIIVFGVLAGLVFQLLNLMDRRVGLGSSPHLELEIGWCWSVAVLITGFALVGFVDDFVVPRMAAGKRGLGWKQKIVMQLVVAIVATGLVCGWKPTPQFGLYIFLILFGSNAYNFLDGLDALAGCVLIILCCGLILVTSVLGGYALTSVLLALIGATVPFLFLNAPPAKLFMGDVGSLPIGSVLGLVFAVMMSPPLEKLISFYQTLLGNPGPALIGSFEWMPIIVSFLGLVLVAELVPVPLQIFWVKVFKRKLFFYTPIHHAFEKKGWAETRVVCLFALTQFVLCVLAYTIVAKDLPVGGPDTPGMQIIGR